MSTALLRQALELFQDDFDSGSTKTEKKKKNKDPLKLIGTEKKGVKKKLEKLKSLRAAKQSKKAKAVKCAVEEYRKRLVPDHTQNNLHLLHQLSVVGKTDSKPTEMILQQHRGRLAKQKPEVKKEEESTVFTDRDFDEFEKEYFS